MKRTKYSRYDRENFFKILAKYEQALKTGTKREIISLSLAIHAAKARVPKGYCPLVGKVFKNTTRETPLED